jgi:hypothetical protein
MPCHSELSMHVPKRCHFISCRVGCNKKSRLGMSPARQPAPAALSCGEEFRDSSRLPT